MAFIFSVLLASASAAVTALAVTPMVMVAVSGTWRTSPWPPNVISRCNGSSDRDGVAVASINAKAPLANKVFSMERLPNFIALVANNCGCTRADFQRNGGSSKLRSLRE